MLCQQKRVVNKVSKNLNNDQRKESSIMKKILLSVLITCSLMSARATVSVFDAFLSGPNESPGNASPGIGFAIVNYDDSLNTLQVLVNFSGLVSNTTASHIHAATAVAGAGNAGVATTTPTFAGFPLGVTLGVYFNTLDLTSTNSYNPSYITAHGGTTAGAQAALVLAMFEGKSYLNIHSTAFPGGEIRGFLTLVPEPSTLALVGLGGVGMAVRARNKKLAGRA